MNNATNKILDGSKVKTVVLSGTVSSLSSTLSSPGLPHLMKTVLKLQEKEWGSVRFVNEEDDLGELKSPQSPFLTDTSHHYHINSLVFSLHNTRSPGNTSVESTDSCSSGKNTPYEYILAVLSSGDRVNLTKLEQAVIQCYSSTEKSDDADGNVESGLDFAEQRTPTVSLAPTERLPYLCGFSSGTVPPLGLCPSPSMTIVDQSLVDTVLSNSRNGNKGDDSSSARLIAGGGRHGQRLELSLDVLLDYGINVHVKEIHDNRIFRNSLTTNAKLSDQGDKDAFLSSGLTVLRGHTEERILKPYFVVAPPDMERAKRIIDKNDSGSNEAVNESSRDDNSDNLSLTPEWVSVVGRITGVRQMARRLVFADLAPPVVVHNDSLESDDHPWRNPTGAILSSGSEFDDAMAVQLIFGKTLIQRLGVDDGEAAMRRIKPGMIVLIQGKTNVGSRDSLRNWVRKRSLDVVVFDYQAMFTEASLLSVSTTDRRPKISLTQTIAKSSKHSSVATTYPSQSDLPVLKISDVYANAEDVVHLVDDYDSISKFKQDITEWLDGNPNDFAMVGVDSEWKPNFLAEKESEPQPVLLLQLCFHPLRRVYLIDLQSVAIPFKKPDDPLVDHQEILLSESLRLIFQTPRLIKVGYQVLNDFQKLAGSYPNLEGLDRVESILECSKFALKTMQMTRQPGGSIVTSSLNRLVEFMVPGKSLDKTQQTSDWSIRPLKQSQLDYASLDAAVLPVIVERLMELIGCHLYSTSGDCNAPELGRWDDDKAFRNMIQSSRFLFLDCEIDRQAAQKLRAKKVVSGQENVLVATQTWKSGDEMPDLPSVPITDKDPYTDLDGNVQVPSSSLSVRQMDSHGKDCLAPFVGQWGAKSKQDCIRLLVELGYADDEPLPLHPDDQIDFPQRSGYAELKNAVVLFVTLPLRRDGRGGNRNYPNEWLEDGSIMSWFLRENEWQNGTSDLAKKLTSTEGSADKLLDPLVLLFVRQGKKEFFFCGRCQVVHLQPTKAETNEEGSRFQISSSRPTAAGIIKLFLLLKDWSKLQQLEDFNDLVRL
jgi:hypothetical protein